MKKILYTQRVEIIKNYQERRDCADQNIPKLLEECGYTPIPIPNILSMVNNYIDILNPDGILLTGGNSLCKYGGNAIEKDEVDKKLISVAIERKIPLYGFCRGMQSILDYFDVKLYEVKGHVAVHHRITGDWGDMIVNSFHNQATFINEIDLPLIVTEQTSDGVVEAIKHKDLPIIGTMWHPEREIPYNCNDVNRIKEFFR